MFKKQQVKFFSYILSHQSKNINDSKPINISITGAAGNIGYAIAFRIAAGDLFGPNQLIKLN